MFLERFLEKRYTFKQPSDEFYDAWTDGGPTVSGERVSPERALGLSAYFAGLRAISEDIAKLPFPLYQRLSRGKKRRPDHPVYGLIHDRPNPETGAMAFWSTLVGHALSLGNGLAEIQRTIGGTPVALWQLDPNAVRIYRGTDHQIRYEIRYPDRDSRTLLWENVFHLHGFGFDGITGYSVAQKARDDISAALGSRNHGAALFGNASRPGGIVSYKNAIKDPEKWHEAWDSTFKGSLNAHKTAVLDNDAKYTPISVPHKDSQWIESQNFSVEVIARWLRMPPHKLQHLVYGTYANVDHLAIEYVVDTLGSWMKLVEQEVWYKLLLPRERAKLFAEFIPEGLLRGDIKTRYEAYKIARYGGWFSANDILEKENGNPLPGDQGDVYWAPANMVPAEKFGESPPAPTQAPAPGDEPSRAAVKLLMADMTRRLASDASETGGERLPTPAEVIERTVKAHAPLLRDAYARTLHVECDKIHRNAKRVQFSKWLLEFRETHKAHVEGALALPVESLVGVVWAILREDGAPNGELGEHIRGMADRYTRRASNRLWRQKSDIDEYATNEVTEELPKLAEMLAGLCTETGNVRTQAE